MAYAWVLSALWVGLALVETRLAIWFRVSTALSEIVVGTVAQTFCFCSWRGGREGTVRAGGHTVL